jgi:division protein CdvB (Snf7/Vps24/ESCRT-III family)
MMHISRDWHERCRLESEYKYEVDLQSATIDARLAAEEARKWQTKYNKLQQQADAKLKKVQQQAEAELRQAQQRIAELESRLGT